MGIGQGYKRSPRVACCRHVGAHSRLHMAQKHAILCAVEGPHSTRVVSKPIICTAAKGFIQRCSNSLASSPFLLAYLGASWTCTETGFHRWWGACMWKLHRMTVRNQPHSVAFHSFGKRLCVGKRRG